ncbi:MAG: hypothetical protein E5W70_03595 [Mesorhizobium sp.]|uniref:hypothetical protein n=1 Tax=Mesorhizobium sp. TaxID=1871066 RepID=UPI00121D9B10|nr:hypothetical protein [Mesorhizobium sp.]TIT24403.1 MAG: hypothetical protein E5W70_03595 [Mesorhizobium sp.]
MMLALSLLPINAQAKDIAAQNNLIIQIGRATALGQLCGRHGIRERQLAKYLNPFGLRLKNPNIADWIDAEKWNALNTEFETMPRPSACAMAEVLYGPTGSVLPGLFEAD